MASCSVGRHISHSQDFRKFERGIRIWNYANIGAAVWLPTCKCGVEDEHASESLGLRSFDEFIETVKRALKVRPEPRPHVALR